MSSQPAPRILLCVSGGIAAYKAIELASMLYKAGYELRTVLTENATKFVSPLNFAAITHSNVHSSLWEDSDPIPHITLADWADLVVVAPATANAIAKAAHGLADDLFSSLLLAHQKPVLWLPAMNVHMFENPIVQQNLALLSARGDHILSPASGLLACGYEGQGKYPPNIDVMHAISCYLKRGEDLHGIRVLVTAGGTAEAIDPMRIISNRSSGKMGIALARALALRGAQVSLVYANISVDLPHLMHQSIKVNTVDEMYAAVMSLAAEMEWIIKCAAVSDFKPSLSSTHKIKKGQALSLELIPTPDILAQLGKLKPAKQKLIGFAAETQELFSHAQAKLHSKNLDLIVANHLDNATSETNAIYLIDSHSTGAGAPLCADKNELAHAIIDRVLQL